MSRALTLLVCSTLAALSPTVSAAADRVPVELARQAVQESASFAEAVASDHLFIAPANRRWAWTRWVLSRFSSEEPVRLGWRQLRALRQSPSLSGTLQALEQTVEEGAPADVALVHALRCAEKADAQRQEAAWAAVVIADKHRHLAASRVALAQLLAARGEALAADRLMAEALEIEWREDWSRLRSHWRASPSRPAGLAVEVEELAASARACVDEAGWDMEDLVVSFPSPPYRPIDGGPETYAPDGVTSEDTPNQDSDGYRPIDGGLIARAPSTPHRVDHSGGEDGSPLSSYAALDSGLAEYGGYESPKSCFVDSVFVWDPDAACLSHPPRGPRDLPETEVPDGVSLPHPVDGVLRDLVISMNHREWVFPTLVPTTIARVAVGQVESLLLSPAPPDTLLTDRFEESEHLLLFLVDSADLSDATPIVSRVAGSACGSKRSCRIYVAPLDRGLGQRVLVGVHILSSLHPSWLMPGAWFYQVATSG